MALDPWEVLGIRHDASLADVDAAYRRLAALFHPDRLRGLRREARAEGERRFREATEAVVAIRARLPGRDHPPPTSEPDGARHHWPGQGVRAADAAALAYNAQIRALDRTGWHATWPGRHAAGVYAALKRAHTIDGPVLQVEWGAYECTLRGREVRALLSAVLPPDDGDWRGEPLENLHDAPSAGAGAGRRARPGGTEGLRLGVLDPLLHDGGRYLVTAEVFVDFE